MGNPFAKPRSASARPAVDRSKTSWTESPVKDVDVLRKNPNGLPQSSMPTFDYGYRHVGTIYFGTKSSELDFNDRERLDELAKAWYYLLSDLRDQLRADSRTRVTIRAFVRGSHDERRSFGPENSQLAMLRAWGVQQYLIIRFFYWYTSTLSSLDREWLTNGQVNFSVGMQAESVPTPHSVGSRDTDERALKRSATIKASITVAVVNRVTLEPIATKISFRLYVESANLFGVAKKLNGLLLGRMVGEALEHRWALSISGLTLAVPKVLPGTIPVGLPEKWIAEGVVPERIDLNFKPWKERKVSVISDDRGILALTIHNASDGVDPDAFALEGDRFRKRDYELSFKIFGLESSTVFSGIGSIEYLGKREPMVFYKGTVPA